MQEERPMPTHMTPWNTSLTGSEPIFRLFDTMLNGTAPRNEELSTRTWAPPVDIRETPEAYLLHVELPGLTRGDLEITLENNVLRLSGERKFDPDAQKQVYHRLERPYGAFARSFTLPSQVAADRVEATFQDGVLTVTVPKAEQAKPRKINIG
jgi:HSP20 family protein